MVLKLDNYQLSKATLAFTHGRRRRWCCGRAYCLLRDQCPRVTGACAWQLQSLTPRLKPNPRARKTGPPMKLYSADEVQALAIAKFGTLEAVEAERDRRLAAREQRAEAKLQRAHPSSPGLR